MTNTCFRPLCHLNEYAAALINEAPKFALEVTASFFAEEFVFWVCQCNHFGSQGCIWWQGERKWIVNTGKLVCSLSCPRILSAFQELPVSPELVDLSEETLPSVAKETGCGAFANWTSERSIIALNGQQLLILKWGSFFFGEWFIVII